MVSMLAGCLCRRSPRPLPWGGLQQQGNEEWRRQVFRLRLLHGRLWVGACFVLHRGQDPGRGVALVGGPLPQFCPGPEDCEA